MTLRRISLSIGSVVLGVILVCLLVKFGKINLRLLLQQVESVSPVAFLKMVLLNGILVYLSTEKWRSIDAVLRHPSDSVPSQFESYVLSSMGMALGLVLPVQIGMSTARTLGTYTHGRPLKRGTAGTLFEQSFDVLVVLFMAGASGATWFFKGGALMWMVSAVVMTVFALLAARPSIALIRWIAMSYNARTAAPHNRILRSLWDIQHSRLLNAGLARRLVSLSTIRFGVVVLMAAQTSEAIHANIPVWHLAAAMPFVVIATVVAVTPGGIGVNEFTSTTALNLFGTPLSVAAGWSLANRVLVTASCFAVAGSAVFMWGIERISASRKYANK
jgi:uncharacterized membrane protein YbhN (UPF0104 family)